MPPSTHVPSVDSHLGTVLTQHTKGALQPGTEPSTTPLPHRTLSRSHLPGHTHLKASLGVTTITTTPQAVRGWQFRVITSRLVAAERFCLYSSVPRHLASAWCFTLRHDAENQQGAAARSGSLQELSQASCSGGEDNSPMRDGDAPSSPSALQAGAGPAELGCSICSSTLRERALRKGPGSATHAVPPDTDAARAFLPDRWQEGGEGGGGRKGTSSG